MLKLAVITGASRGIGLAFTEKLLAKDNDIHVLTVSRTEGKLTELKEAYPNRLYIISGVDLRAQAHTAAVIVEIIQFAIKNDCKVAYLVNNAAMLGPLGPFNKVLTDAVSRALNLNANAPLLLAHGLQYVFSEDARVLNISSRAATMVIDGLNTYCLTKASLKASTEQLKASADFRPAINLLIPGEVNTVMQKELRDSDHSCGDFARGNEANLIPPEITAAFMYFVLTQTTKEEFQAPDDWYIYNAEHHARWMPKEQVFEYLEPGTSPPAEAATTARTTSTSTAATSSMIERLRNEANDTGGAEGGADDAEATTATATPSYVS